MDGESEDSEEEEDRPYQKPVVVVRKSSRSHAVTPNNAMLSLSSLSQIRTPFSSLSSLSSFSVKPSTNSKRFVPRSECATVVKRVPKGSEGAVSKRGEGVAVSRKGESAILKGGEGVISKKSDDVISKKSDGPILKKNNDMTSKNKIANDVNGRKEAEKTAKKKEKRGEKKGKRQTKRNEEQSKQSTMIQEEHTLPPITQEKPVPPISQERHAPSIAREIEQEQKRIDSIMQERSNSIVHNQMREENVSCVIFSQYEE